MKNWLTFRFIVAAVMIALGCYAMIANWHGFGIFFMSVSVIMMSRSELTRPIPRRENFIFAGAALAFVILLISCQWLIPKSAAAAIDHATRHPAFVLPMGLLFYWGLYRMYRRRKGGADC
ncbi:MAG TPA: hypothetical protein VGO57_14180 [Verrucomicrobiae bacterium]|jgi:hypothetical protein